MTRTPVTSTPVTKTPSPAQLRRRSMLLRGGALAAGVVGAGAVAGLGAAPAAAASGAFTAISPFRCYDTRQDPAGKLLFDEVLDLQAWTDAGGATMFSSTATAVTFNLTVTQTESLGYLAVFPGSTVSFAPFSTLNWVTAGIDLANGGVVALGTSANSGAGSLLIAMGGYPNAASHVIIDITGWYA